MAADDEDARSPVCRRRSVQWRGDRSVARQSLWRAQGRRHRGGATCALRGSAFVPHDLAAPIRGAKFGPLAGLTAAVKDMYDITGERTGGGSPEWLASREPATANSACVQRLLDTGADIIGKTICDEFFF